MTVFSFINHQWCTHIFDSIKIARVYHKVLGYVIVSSILDNNTLDILAFRPEIFLNLNNRKFASEYKIREQEKLPQRDG